MYICIKGGGFMVERISNKIIDYQIEKGIISKNDINIYRYGYILLFEVMINILISLGIGIILGKVTEILFFLACFIILRSFCGGYHANSILKCVFLSNLVMTISILSNILLSKYTMPIPLFFILEISFSIIICVLSPVDNKNKRLSNNEKSFYKKCTIIVSVAENSIGIILMLFNKQEYAYLVLFVFLIQMVSLMIVKGQNKLINEIL